MTVDETDKRILRLLQENARASFRAIADKIGIRAPSVHARVKRLEDDGVIRGYRADIDPAKINRPLTAFVLIGLEGGRRDATPRTEAVTQVLRRHPEVAEVHAVTGEDDLLVKIKVGDIAAVERVLIRVLEPLDGVRRTTTLIVVRGLLERVVPV